MPGQLDAIGREVDPAQRHFRTLALRSRRKGGQQVHQELLSFFGPAHHCQAKPLDGRILNG